MVKAIIFDFFGVICPDLYWAWLKDHVKNLELQRQYFQELSNDLDLGKLTVSEFAEKLSAKSDVDSKEIIPQIHSYTSIDKELVGFIEKLKKDYKVGLLSNARASMIEEILTKNDLTNLFDSVVISEKVGFIKPQAEIFQFALDSLKTKPEETVFVDDREVHTNAASKLGIKSLVFTTSEELRVNLRDNGVSV